MKKIVCVCALFEKNGDKSWTVAYRAAWKLEGEQVCAQGEIVESKR